MALMTKVIAVRHGLVWSGGLAITAIKGGSALCGKHRL